MLKRLKSLFQDSRYSISRNGWTLGHTLHWFILSSLLMILDLWSIQQKGASLFCAFLLSLSLLPFLRNLGPFIWASILLIYSFKVVIGALGLLLWPTIGVYIGMLFCYSLLKPYQFCWPSLLFENYRLLLGVSGIGYLILASPFDSWFSWALLAWSTLLIIVGFLWQIRFPQFVFVMESALVVFGTCVLYAGLIDSEFKGLCALIFMLVMSGVNFLIWPARRQEKPALEYLYYSHGSATDLGWVRFLRLEQWRSSPICFHIEEGTALSFKNEEGVLLTKPAFVWHMMRSCGGLWVLWAKFFEKMPLKIQLKAIQFFEFCIKISPKEMPLDVIAAIEERTR